MKKKYTSLYTIVVIATLLFVVFYFMMPKSYDTTEAPLSKFSTKRALGIVKEMTKKPHYVGSENHEIVAQYLLKELRNLGLEPTIQEGFTMTEKGTLVYSKNIVTKIKGSSSEKSLLLLSHYDSAPHSYSKGASDDASGIATILESVRAFLHTKTKHKNDIILLFTDAEELGLNGAALFVTNHNWAKEVGLALNFEARGSSGPSYMLMETTKGNAKMVEAFNNANVQFPVSNSLMYSIYKMLPNDTDLTVFREKGNIQGFNFAFIDHHFNYHTSQDSYQNLNPNTLAHQGTYLVPLLNYFSNASLSALESTEDRVYFSVPFTFISYPFTWILPLLLIAFGLLLLFITVGLAKHVLRIDQIILGFVPLLGSLLVAGFVAFIGWKLLLIFYPQYNDILHGFTYNGHDYIYGFVSITLAICFLFYKNKGKRNPEMNKIIAPLFIWLLLNVGLAIKLQGGAFLLLPVIFALFALGFYTLTQKSHWVINIIFSIPTLVIIIPFIQMFPVGLGLKILVGSAVLTVLSFTLLLPLFGTFEKKKSWSFFFIIVAVGFFTKAHLSSSYEEGKAKPNSLVYLLNADSNKAFWTTYDKNLDDWTSNYLGDKPSNAASLNTNILKSKLNSEFTFMNIAPVKNISKPDIQFVKDSIIGSQRFLKITISPNRKVDRYDIFSNTKINNLKANGVLPIDLKSKFSGKISNQILSYYVVDNVPLDLEFTISSKEKLDMNLMESSFDLLTNTNFQMIARKNWMIPTPFVLTDAVVIQQKIKPNTKTPKLVSNLPTKYRFSNKKYSLKITTDTIK